MITYEFLMEHGPLYGVETAKRLVAEDTTKLPAQTT